MDANKAAIWIGVLAIVPSVVIPLATAGLKGSAPRWLWTGSVALLLTGVAIAVAGSLSPPSETLGPAATNTASDPGTAASAGPAPSGTTGAASPVPTPPASPALPVYTWAEKWSGPGVIRRAQSEIDFDASPPPGQYFFGTDLLTEDGTVLRTTRSGKLLTWAGQQEPTAQQCYELITASPADSQYVSRPEVGRWYCLLTDKGFSAGLVVTFRVTQLISQGMELEATAWNRS